MDYTSAPGYVTDAQGRRQYQDRDLLNGVKGTSLVAADRNSVMNSLLYLIQAVQIVPNPNDDTQVWAAVEALIKAALIGVSGTLDFMPVQQGGGPGQSTDKLNIGYDETSKGLRYSATLNGTLTDMGLIAPLTAPVFQNSWGLNVPASQNYAAMWIYRNNVPLWDFGVAAETGTFYFSPHDASGTSLGGTIEFSSTTRMVNIVQGITMPTKTQGDNSTNGASTAYVDTGLATAASNLAAEASTRSGQVATLTADVSACVSGTYGLGSGDFAGKALIMGAVRPAFCYNNGAGDVWGGIAFYSDVTNVQTNLTTEINRATAAEASLTTNVNARVSGSYGVGSGAFPGKSLFMGASLPAFCYNQNGSDMWLGLLSGSQSAVTNGMRTVIGSQALLAYFIETVPSNGEIVFPVAFSAQPTVILQGSMSSPQIENNTLTAEGFTTNISSGGMWVWAFGAK